ncbi:MAG TPA: ABC transporter substrate-binding protein [Chloroflexota bacterium]|jgi:ABC-type nitrate/sulfonate/bicarbonate transport system substrate-binding protein|nr:ABC transporter substrate-binding protein [Chloroflexota bacterium]
MRLLFAFGLLALTACAPARPVAIEPAQPRTLHFMAGYKPQANLPFVAVYVAQTNGYFAQQGLQVDIQHASGQGEHLKLLLQGSEDVITASADEVLARRAEGVPVLAISVLGQRNQRAYAVKADSVINTPKDWEGRLVGFKVEPAPDYLALLASAGVDRSRIREVPVGFDPRLLATGTVDVYPVFESNEPDTLQRLNVPVRLFKTGDYGVPGMGLTFETRDALVTQDPDLLTRFTKAAMHGVEFARDYPDQATDIVMKFAPQEDRDHQRAMLDVELDMANGPLTGSRGLGFASPDQWQALHDSLLKYGGIKSATPVSASYTDRFLQATTRDGHVIWP